MGRAAGTMSQRVERTGANDGPGGLVDASISRSVPPDKLHALGGAAVCSVEVANPEAASRMREKALLGRRALPSALRGAWNRLLQAIALYVPGATTTRVWLHRMRGVKIGDGTFISTAAIVETEHPELVSIGERTSIGIRAVIIAHFWTHLGVHIGDDVFIGPGAIIMPGVRIGNGAVVTAGSVVTKSVPDLTMVRGNPAVAVARCSLPLGVATPIDEFTRGLRPIRVRRENAR